MGDPKAFEFAKENIISDINFEEILKNASAEIGRANVLIAGKTGVGKSTLINSVFAGNLSKTGKGEPVTKSTRKYSKKGIPISIYDTRGLELTEYQKTLSDLEKIIVAQKAKADPTEHIHCGWICISEGSDRFEEGETALADLFTRHEVPFIIVLTKCDAEDSQFVQTVKKNFQYASQVVQTMAKPKNIRGGHVVPAFGLKELVEATIEVIPEGQRTAFAAAQTVSKDQKRAAAKNVVKVAAAAAAAAGATPIPVSDWMLLVPIQIGMLAKISRIYGFDLTTTFLLTLLKGSFGSGLATRLGLQIMGSLLKWIPGLGTAAGSMIAGATASAITTALGLTYIKTTGAIAASRDPLEVSAEDVAAAFKADMKDPVREHETDMKSHIPKRKAA